MPKRNAALAGALSLLLLAACGSREGESANNTAADGPEANAIGTAAPADPAQPALPGNDSADPVPPPDAVSHPDGYLPPAPAEPDPPAANSSGPDPSPPATEDEYLRNRQSGR